MLARVLHGPPFPSLAFAGDSPGPSLLPGRPPAAACSCRRCWRRSAAACSAGACRRRCRHPRLCPSRPGRGRWAGCGSRCGLPAGQGSTGPVRWVARGERPLQSQEIIHSQALPERCSSAACTSSCTGSATEPLLASATHIGKLPRPPAHLQMQRRRRACRRPARHKRRPAEGAAWRCRTGVRCGGKAGQHVQRGQRAQQAAEAVMPVQKQLGALRGSGLGGRSTTLTSWRHHELALSRCQLHQNPVQSSLL